MQNLKHFMAAVGIIVLPMLCIVGQRETGSALVYLSFFLMLYREGMPGAILFTGVSMVAYFVLGVKYENVMMWDTYTSVGKFVVLLLVQIFTAGMVNSYTGDKKQALLLLAYSVGITLLFVLFSTYVIPFDIVWIPALPVCYAHRIPGLSGSENPVPELLPHLDLLVGKYRFFLFCRLCVESCDGTSSASAYQRTAGTG